MEKQKPKNILPLISLYTLLISSYIFYAFPLISPLFQAQFYSKLFYIPSPSSGGMGNGGCSQVIKTCPYSSFFPMLFSCYTVWSLLKYIMAEVPPVSLTGSALASRRSLLGLTGTGSVWLGAAPDFSYHKSSLQPPAIRILPCKPNTSSYSGQHLT